MKFAKELERDLVPEWRAKYLDYKTGKKKLKAIARAQRNVEQTPRLLRRSNTNTFSTSPENSLPQYAYRNRYRSHSNGSGYAGPFGLNNGQADPRSKPNGSSSSPEEAPLNGGRKEEFPGMTRYGSIIGTPPKRTKSTNSGRSKAPPSLKLPGAALDDDNPSPQQGPSANKPATLPRAKHVTLPPPIAPSAENAFEVGETRSPHRNASTLPARYKSIFNPKRVNTAPGGHVTENPRPLLNRVFSMKDKSAPPSPGDVPMEAYRDLDDRRDEFLSFLDSELEKIESFYKQKEDEATERLKVLREQLHIMRDRRLDELVSQQTSKIKAKEKKKSTATEALMNGHQSSSEDEEGKSNTRAMLDRINPLDSALNAVKAGKYGHKTKAMTDLASPTGLFLREHLDDHRDFQRRPDLPDVPYQTARKKLKVALQEHYRGLELLKSYALLNRTAFRKINKKFDKTVNAHPPMRYMSDKVNKAWFVQSDVIEEHIRTVEDLYARYFEKGNHKVAIGKLRVKMARAGDFTKNSFRNGLTLAAGLVFGIQGLVYGAELLHTGDAVRDVHTSYLLQIYAGYFLMNFLFLLFCMACRMWHESKINYAFVFEYDTRHHLDWRQLCELPCFYLFLLGLFMWLNFCQFGGEAMYLYYPTILIGVTALMLVLPLPILYSRSRQWLLYSLWRLLLAGIYPVEFRDFYLGDMFCSLTYAMGNIELFFCLYANNWADPPMCNSSHSRLLGFFCALPSIWRALQCLRRYYDTRNVFPHLVNCGKYAAGIVFYITLSTYRIDKSETNRAIFIAFATINSIYTSIWDVVMDWSLGDPYAENRFLRPTLGYKKVWMYYIAMVIDPILRFNWILYAGMPRQLQHSAVTSFAVAFSEVCRRGMWTLFRVENEHCTNVGRFRASRDVPLPYDLTSSESQEQLHHHPELADHQPQRSHGLARTQSHPDTAMLAGGRHAQTFASSSDLEQQIRHQRTRSSTLPRANTINIDGQASPLAWGLNRMGTILRDAHVQDFERKKKVDVGTQDSNTAAAFHHHDDDSETDNDEDREDSEPHSRASEDEADGRAKSAEEIREVRRDVEAGRGRGEDDSVLPG